MDPQKPAPGDESSADGEAFHKARRALAHDMRNPLTVILGNAQLINDLDPSASIRASAEDIHDAAEQLRRLIDSFGRGE